MDPAPKARQPPSTARSIAAKAKQETFYTPRAPFATMTPSPDRLAASSRRVDDGTPAVARDLHPSFAASSSKAGPIGVISPSKVPPSAIRDVDPEVAADGQTAVFRSPDGRYVVEVDMEPGLECNTCANKRLAHDRHELKEREHEQEVMEERLALEAAKMEAEEDLKRAAASRLAKQQRLLSGLHEKEREHEEKVARERAEQEKWKREKEEESRHTLAEDARHDAESKRKHEKYREDLLQQIEERKKREKQEEIERMTPSKGTVLGMMEDRKYSGMDALHRRQQEFRETLRKQIEERDRMEKEHAKEDQEMDYSRINAAQRALMEEESQRRQQEEEKKRRLRRTLLDQMHEKDQSDGVDTEEGGMVLIGPSDDEIEKAKRDFVERQKKIREEFLLTSAQKEALKRREFLEKEEEGRQLSMLEAIEREAAAKEREERRRKNAEFRSEMEKQAREDEERYRREKESEIEGELKTISQVSTTSESDRRSLRMKNEERKRMIREEYQKAMQASAARRRKEEEEKKQELEDLTAAARQELEHAAMEEHQRRMSAKKQRELLKQQIVERELSHRQSSSDEGGSLLFRQDADKDEMLKRVLARQEMVKRDLDECLTSRKKLSAAERRAEAEIERQMLEADRMEVRSAQEKDFHLRKKVQESLREEWIRSLNGSERKKREDRDRMIAEREAMDESLLASKASDSKKIMEIRERRRQEALDAYSTVANERAKKEMLAKSRDAALDRAWLERSMEPLTEQLMLCSSCHGAYSPSNFVGADPTSTSVRPRRPSSRSPIV
eukprot:TRINITY_DN4946_c0_g1_i1.p1 TRINITY_DN4946_c0_g1~~TRINITY_DN4946_c0_g1_i1.p1  ORF type:complete len:894 (-),score=317.46 TRINITY_DN4946_c0_g1_i1:144-2507(-)